MEKFPIKKPKSMLRNGSLLAVEKNGLVCRMIDIRVTDIFDILLLYLRLTQKSFAVDILFFFSLFLALFLEGLVEAFL